MSPSGHCCLSNLDFLPTQSFWSLIGVLVSQECLSSVCSDLLVALQLSFPAGVRLRDTLSSPWLIRSVWQS